MKNICLLLFIFTVITSCIKKIESHPEYYPEIDSIVPKYIPEGTRFIKVYGKNFSTRSDENIVNIDSMPVKATAKGNYLQVELPDKVFNDSTFAAYLTVSISGRWTFTGIFSMDAPRIYSYGPEILHASDTLIIHGDGFNETRDKRKFTFFSTYYFTTDDDTMIDGLTHAKPKVVLFEGTSVVKIIIPEKPVDISAFSLSSTRAKFGSFSDGPNGIGVTLPIKVVPK